jgi:hypothetical protein
MCEGSKLFNFPLLWNLGLCVMLSAFLFSRASGR